MPKRNSCQRPYRDRSTTIPALGSIDVSTPSRITRVLNFTKNINCTVTYLVQLPHSKYCNAVSAADVLNRFSSRSTVRQEHLLNSRTQCANAATHVAKSRLFNCCNIARRNRPHFSTGIALSIISVPTTRTHNAARKTHTDFDSLPLLTNK